MRIFKKSALFALNALLIIAIGSGCVSNTKPKGQNNLSSTSASNISTASSVSLTGDVFMQYVKSHNYKVLPNSEAGGPVFIIYYTKPDIGDNVYTVFKRAVESSTKLGYDLSPYQGKAVDFHTCGIDLGHNKIAEADCFIYDNKIIGFWIFTPAAGTAKEDYDSYIMMNWCSAKPIINYSTASIDFLSLSLGYLNVCIDTTASNGEAQTYRLIKTTDGGKSWATINKNTPVSGISFLNEKNGYSITEDGKVVKTKDGGTTWSPSGFFTNKSVESIDLINNNVMFFTIDTANSLVYNVYRTEDGGKSWKAIKLPDSSDECCWLNSQCGYALYSDSKKAALYYTDNGGKTWAVKKSSARINTFVSGDFTTDIEFFSDGVGYIGQDDGPLIRTADGGKNFTALPEYDRIEGRHYMSSVPDLINSEEGFTSYLNHPLSRTTDGCKHWTDIITNDDLQSIMSKSN